MGTQFRWFEKYRGGQLAARVAEMGMIVQQRISITRIDLRKGRFKAVQHCSEVKYTRLDSDFFRPTVELLDRIVKESSPSGIAKD